MAPSPITTNFDQLDIVDFSNELLFRQREFDAKAVGAHLTISKRNSTPISCGLTNLKNGLNILTNQHFASMKNSGIISPTDRQNENSHRRLDRSFSEPARPQQQQQQQQQPSQLGQPGASRYKTELCRPFAETGKCKYSDKCQFAHGIEEIRSMTRHPKYKTELCRTFHSSGLCGYGIRCHFIHNEDERRSSNSPPILSSSPSNGMGGPSTIPFACDEYGNLGDSYASSYLLSQSNISSENISFASNFSEQHSPTQLNSAHVSPASMGHSPQLSPTAETTFCNSIFAQNDQFLDQSAQLLDQSGRQHLLSPNVQILDQQSGQILEHCVNSANSELLMKKLIARQILKANWKTLENDPGPLIEQLKYTILENRDPPLINYGMRNPGNANNAVRLPIFENLTTATKV